MSIDAQEHYSATIKLADEYKAVITVVDSFNGSYSSNRKDQDKYSATYEVKIPIKEYEVIADEYGDIISFPDPRYSGMFDRAIYHNPIDVIAANFNPIYSEYTSTGEYSSIIKNMTTYRAEWAVATN